MALVALLLPGMLVGISAGYAEIERSLGSFFINWALLVSPQLLLLVLAMAFPTLRGAWVNRTLIVLTALVVSFEVFVFWFTDANGPMWFAIYFPLNFTILVFALILRKAPATNVGSEL